jgi:hypothetical protein
MREPRWSSRGDAGQGNASVAHYASGDLTGRRTRCPDACRGAAGGRHDAVQGRHVPFRRALRRPLRCERRPRGRPSAAPRHAAPRHAAPARQAPVAAL